MSQNNKEKEKLPLPSVEFPIKYEKTRQILEFVPNTINSGEAVIVKTKKYWGLSEPCFVVHNNNGKIEIRQIKEERE